MAHGIDFATQIKISHEYGMSTWDFNSMFIMLTPSMIVPFAYYKSYKGLDEKLNEFIKLIMKHELATGDTDLISITFLRQALKLLF